MCNVIKFDKNVKPRTADCFYLVIGSSIKAFNSLDSALDAISFNGEILPIFKSKIVKIFESYGNGINESLHCVYFGGA